MTNVFWLHTGHVQLISVCFW